MIFWSILSIDALLHREGKGCHIGKNRKYVTCIERRQPEIRDQMDGTGVAGSCAHRAAAFCDWVAEIKCWCAETRIKTRLELKPASISNKSSNLTVHENTCLNLLLWLPIWRENMTIWLSSIKCWYYCPQWSWPAASKWVLKTGIQIIQNQELEIQTNIR